MEAQLIHYRKTNVNLEAALKDAEGFAIISILFAVKFNIINIKYRVLNYDHVSD